MSGEQNAVEAVALPPCPFCAGPAVRKENPGRPNEMYGLVVDHADGCFLGLQVIEDDASIDAAWSARAAMPATPADQDKLVKAVREAIILIDEINERATSRQFNGIGQALHAKLCTVRGTLQIGLIAGTRQIGGGQ